MAYSESPQADAIWVAELPGGQIPRTRPLIRSTGRERGATWSPDGKRIADISDQSGEDEIWLSDSNGAGRRQLTHLQGPRLDRPHWSPDGGWLLFSARQERRNEVYRVAVDGSSKPVRVLDRSNRGGRGLLLPPIAGSVSWSHDGESLYYESENAIWKVGLDGGPPRQITHQRPASSPEESVDGKFLYYRSRRAIWRVPSDGGEEEEFVVPEHDLFWTTIQPAATGVYYLEWDRGRRALNVEFYDFASKANTVAFQIADTGISPQTTFSISPDGKQILYPKIERDETNLVVVENFR
jgi:dipeptidyl aminopeptidase/acylaminoacyl peptidase